MLCAVNGGVNPVRSGLDPVKRGVLPGVAGAGTAGRGHVKERQQVCEISSTQVTVPPGLEPVAGSSMEIAGRYRVSRSRGVGGPVHGGDVPGFGGPVATLGLLVTAQRPVQDGPHFGVAPLRVSILLDGEPIAVLSCHGAIRGRLVTEAAGCDGLPCGGWSGVTVRLVLTGLGDTGFRTGPLSRSVGCVGRVTTADGRRILEFTVYTRLAQWFRQ